MTDQPTMPKFPLGRGEQGPRKAPVTVPDDRKLEVEREAIRREAIASATREWIIPALVRRFLAERSSDREAVRQVSESSS
jgi:hypothetical protein